MNALQFANANEHVLVFFAGNGCPAGRTEFWFAPETQLPFDLEEVEGEVSAEGTFEANNLNDGSGAHGWKFADERGNTIYKIQLFTDRGQWESLFVEWATSDGDYKSALEYCESEGISEESLQSLREAVAESAEEEV